MQECAGAMHSKCGSMIHSVSPLWHKDKAGDYVASTLASRLVAAQEWQNVNDEDLLKLTSMYHQADSPSVALLHQATVWPVMITCMPCLEVGCCFWLQSGSASFKSCALSCEPKQVTRRPCMQLFDLLASSLCPPQQAAATFTDAAMSLLAIAACRKSISGSVKDAEEEAECKRQITVAASYVRSVLAPGYVPAETLQDVNKARHHLHCPAAHIPFCLPRDPVLLQSFLRLT
jgi:hypothetical protein